MPLNAVQMYLPASFSVTLTKRSVLPLSVKFVSPSFVHVMVAEGLLLALQNSEFESLSLTVMLCGDWDISGETVKQKEKDQF